MYCKRDYIYGDDERNLICSVHDLGNLDDPYSERNRKRLCLKCNSKFKERLRRNR